MGSIRVDWSSVEDRKPVTFDDIRHKLSNLKNVGGGEYQAACPCCEDAGGHHLYTTEKEGYLQMYCQKCGMSSIRTFMDALGERRREPMTTAAPPKSKKLIEDIFYEYRNTDGTLAFKKRRLKWEDGSKNFYFVGPNDTNRKPKESIWIYGLDRLAEADRNETLYIVEGEKCADAMRRQGFLTITTCTGAKKDINFTQEEKILLSEFMTKIIIPDNDEPGQDYIQAWENVQVLRLPDIWPDCPLKGDVADYFEAGLPASAIRDYKPVTILLPQYVGNRYKVAHSGVFGKRKADAEEYDLPICQHPVIPYRRFKDVWTGKEKYELAYFRDGVWKYTNIPAEDLISGNQLQRHAADGLMISGTKAKPLADFFHDYIGEHPLEVTKTSSRMGWYQDNFIPYVGGIKLDCGNDALMRGILPLGSMEKWKEGILPIWQSRPEVAAFMCVGMASVIIGRQNGDSFVCELHGPTELGKTKALEVVASMFGLPSTNGLMFIMDSTDNFAENILNALNNVPMCLDENEARRNSFEFQRIKNPENSWLYKVTANKGRQRMKSGHEAEAPTRWNTTLLVTGESSMVQENTAEGAQNRLVSIPITESVTDDFAKLTRAIKNNYGHMAGAFIRKFLQLRRVDSLLEEKFKLIKEIRPEVTSKMANNGSYVLVALDIMESILGRSALTPEVFVTYLKTKNDVDLTGTIYTSIINWLAAKDSNVRYARDYQRTVTEGTGISDHYENTGEIIAVRHVDYFAVNKSKLDAFMQENFGKPLKDFQRRLADKGYILASVSKGKTLYSNNESYGGASFKAVRIKNYYFTT